MAGRGRPQRSWRRSSFRYTRATVTHITSTTSKCVRRGRPPSAPRRPNGNGTIRITKAGSCDRRHGSDAWRRRATPPTGQPSSGSGLSSSGLQEHLSQLNRSPAHGSEHSCWRSVCVSDGAAVRERSGDIGAGRERRRRTIAWPHKGSRRVWLVPLDRLGAVTERRCGRARTRPCSRPACLGGRAGSGIDRCSGTVTGAPMGVLR